jgi:hypothetical protein
VPTNQGNDGFRELFWKPKILKDFSGNFGPYHLVTVKSGLATFYPLCWRFRDVVKKGCQA